MREKIDRSTAKGNVHFGKGGTGDGNKIDRPRDRHCSVGKNVG